jgi:thiamine biosynthesis protein ThiS
MTDATDSRLLAVRINGDAREVPGGLTVDVLLAHLGLDPRLVVVERNGVILRRDDLAGAAVEAGDVYELVHFVGGG